MKQQEREKVTWSQGSEQVQVSIAKLIRIIKGLPEPKFTAEEFMNTYTVVYQMCTQKPPDNFDYRLYDTYRETFVEYLTSTVLPSLRPLQPDESLLNQLVNAWENNKVMERLMSRFFNYLDQYYAPRKALPSLKHVALHCFRDSVYLEVGANARDAVVGLIYKEREGEKIDGELVKKVIDIFIEIGGGKMDAYEQDFEAVMLKNTGEYYSRKASSWISEGCSDEDYRLKAEECLAKERDTVSHFLYIRSKEKLINKVRNELFEPLAERTKLAQEAMLQPAENQPSLSESDTPEEVLPGN